ncbi:hypothetical protein [Neobacillus sp. PS3-40]|uniref:hypothetical protein n=1 Tax=Neobacillus sp. PS3-40 TaxID=3070679 RepID=UPI0027DF11F2|nr:hypothetical protein [Neobacillus sp. PS3-40]WML42400.1 hypothetical protein RCG20_10880 [Neobacillus sp. PS3-40]
MSLSKPSFSHIVKKQYSYKLKSYVQVFFTLVVLQVLAIIFSNGGVGTSGASSDGFEINVHYYSAGIVVVFTMLWGFITAVLITTKAYRNDDFSFVTNRLSSNVSNALFLLTASLIGGFTAMFSPYLIRVILYYFTSQQYVTSTSTMATTSELLLGIFSTSLYVFLACALGYFVGTLVQINKIFILLLPAAFFGALIGEGSGKAKIVTALYEFLLTESSVPLFTFKVIVIVGLLFSSSFVVLNRMEVR